MKFYDRENEIDYLQRAWPQSEVSARFTVLTGRRHIGKTSLVLKGIKRNANCADLEVLHGKAMNMTAATRAYNL